MNRPLVLVIEDAKKMIAEAVSAARSSTKLPASIMDGVICSVLADIRKEECIELQEAQYLEKQRILKEIEDLAKPEQEV